jgi:hydrogenase nickel incorporation protein HypB
MDLADVMGISADGLANDVHQLKPDIKVIPTSCKTGKGIEEVANALLAL